MLAQILAQILADDTKTLDKYYIKIDDKVIKQTFNDIFISGNQTKLICGSSGNSEKEKLIYEINGILTSSSISNLKKTGVFS